jgi:hypothetical protein
MWSGGTADSDLAQPACRSLRSSCRRSAPWAAERREWLAASCAATAAGCSAQQTDLHAAASAVACVGHKDNSVDTHDGCTPAWRQLCIRQHHHYRQLPISLPLQLSAAATASRAAGDSGMCSSSVQPFSGARLQSTVQRGSPGMGWHQHAPAVVRGCAGATSCHLRCAARC